MRGATVQDGHVYCAPCGEYVGATLGLVSLKLTPHECYRCGARTLPASLGLSWGGA